MGDFSVASVAGAPRARVVKIYSGESSQPVSAAALEGAANGAVAYNPIALSAGCSGPENHGPGPVVREITDGGIPFQQPDANSGNGGYQRLDSGAILVDGRVILPQDDGGRPRLPTDVFKAIGGNEGCEARGDCAGLHFQGTSWVEVNSGLLQGSGLQSLTLRAEFGTDSTTVSYMPASDPNMSTSYDERCVSGLPNLSQMDPMDLAAGAVGCEDTGFTTFAQCPGDTNFSIPVYLSEYVMEAFTPSTDAQGNPILIKIGEKKETPTHYEDLFNAGSPDGGVAVSQLGPACNHAPDITAMPVNVAIPPAWHADGRLFIKILFKLIVDARHGDANALFLTYLSVKVR